MTFKRCQALPLKLLIISALMLIVMFVLIALFSSKVTLFSKEMTACESKGGICISSTNQAEKNCPWNFAVSKFDCKNDFGLSYDKVCCIRIEKGISSELLETQGGEPLSGDS
tara:strand:- start:80 stop:415 length:336 start_codon:yes stop_codon:yes gene_type:complete